MADYTFAPAVVFIEGTSTLAIGATGVLRPLGGGDPVVVFDLNDSPLPNIAVGQFGVHQSFKANIPAGVLDFGSTMLPTSSLEQQAAAFDALAIATQAAVDAENAAAASLVAADAAAIAESAAVSAAAAAESVPDGVQNIVAEQVVDGTGLDKVLGEGNNTLTLSVVYGNTAGTAVQGSDIRVTDGQNDDVASIRALGSEPGMAAPAIHTHAASQISDASPVGRTVLTSATAADALAALGAPERSRTRGEVTWEENGPGTKWGAVRPSGYKRIIFYDNGATGTEDPGLTIGIVGDFWEDTV